MKTFRHILICGVLLSTGFGMSAQNMYDALKYSADDYTGSARTMGMGNAVTATGGDIATLQFNPAGSAVAGYSQMSITPILSITSSRAIGTALAGQSSPYSYGDGIRNNSTSLEIPNIGFVLNFKTGRKSGVVSFSLGALLCNSGNYRDMLTARGIHEGTSLAGYFASQATGISSASLGADNAYENYAANLVLAWKSGMISTVGSASDVFVGSSEKFTEDEAGNRDFFVPGALDQLYSRRISGNKQDIILNAGINISDFAYIGLNLGVTDMRYSYEEQQNETPVNPSLFDIDFGDAGTTNFMGLNYNNWYVTKGRGLYMKLGTILTPGPLRVGLTIQTPTWFDLKDTWGASARTTYAHSEFNGSATSPEGEYSYRFVSPWKAGVGLAGSVAGRLLLSADYEVAFNKTMRFSDGSIDNGQFSLTNSDIRQCLGTVHTLRVGTEIKPVEAFSIRAGYNLSAVLSGLKAVDNDKYVDVKRTASYAHSVSCGLGYSSRGSFFADVAFRALFSPKEYIYPYPDYNFSDNGTIIRFSPEIEARRILYNIALTVGFRF